MRRTLLTPASLVAMLLAVIVFNPSVSNGGDKKNFGIRAGYQNASMQSVDSIWYNSLNSFYIGGYKEFRFFPFLYAGSGLEYFINGNQKDENNKLLLHYLSVPLDIKLKAGPIFALGGFSLNFKIGEKMMVDGKTINLTGDNKIGWFDSSAFIGAGINILMISIEGRYHWGLVDVNRGFHNNYYQVGLVLHL
jgi:hypothetical protein